ncbi:MAG: glycosyltransferase [Polyangiales bacterium]
MAAPPHAPLVSIIIANWNYGRFLGEAIESALRQTHPNVEVTVVDDGSTDDSVAVASRYPVQLVEQEHLGVSQARNRGVAASQGQLLVFLDADDILEPTFVERCLARLTEQGPRVAYVYTRMRLFGLDEDIFMSRPFERRSLLSGPYVPVTTLMHRAPFEEVGGFDPAWSLALEDYELWIRMLASGYTGVLVPEPLLRYRKHGPSRNGLPGHVTDQLRSQLWITYPRMFWQQILRHPVRAARAYVPSLRLTTGS